MLWVLLLFLQWAKCQLTLSDWTAFWILKGPLHKDVLKRASSIAGTEAFACTVGLCMLPSVYKIQEKENFVLSCLEIETGWYKYVCFVTH